MTRDEFIAAYMDRSGLGPSARTEDGFRRGDRERVALPCACGEPICEGWAMIPNDPELIQDHMTAYSPEARVSAEAD